MEKYYLIIIVFQTKTNIHTLLKIENFMFNHFSNGNILKIEENISNIDGYSTDGLTFIAHNKNGGVHVWGNTNLGGYHENLTDKNNVQNIMSTRGAFIGKNTDGSHFIWGNNNYGGFGGPDLAFNMDNRL